MPPLQPPLLPHATVPASQVKAATVGAAVVGAGVTGATVGATVAVVGGAVTVEGSAVAGAVVGAKVVATVAPGVTQTVPLYASITGLPVPSHLQQRQSQSKGSMECEMHSARQRTCVHVRLVDLELHTLCADGEGNAPSLVLCYYSVYLYKVCPL